MLPGEYVGKPLILGTTGKAVGGDAIVANRTREIRPSGMKRGAWRNVAYGGNVNPSRNRKGGNGNPPPTGARASDLSRRGSRQCPNPAGESPVMSVARFRHVAIPQVMLGNHRIYAWSKRPGCHVIKKVTSVGATWRPSEHGSLNVMEWLQPRN
jgi:hypothetical protein